MKQGIITNSARKQGKNYVNFRFEVEGIWYGIFQNKENKEFLESLNNGDVIQFTPIQKGQYWNMDDVSLVEKASPSAVAKADKKANAKDERIFYSGMMKVAGELVSVGVTQGIIKKPAKASDDGAEWLASVTMAVAQDLGRELEAFLDMEEEEEEAKEDVE